MAEAIISRRQATTRTKSVLKSEVIVSNEVWTVPESINNMYDIRIFGGGGGGGNNCLYGGGGGGWMNNDILELSPNAQIPITVGTGGAYRNSGGTTSFGTYLSANGGGTSANTYTAGDGGSGGGMPIYNIVNGITVTGGTGYQFGGGGPSGNGGIWGGGGSGILCWYLCNWINLNSSNGNGIVNSGTLYGNKRLNKGISNTQGYGGNGGESNQSFTSMSDFNNSTNINGYNGTNTIGLLNNSILEGAGLGSKAMGYFGGISTSNYVHYTSGAGGGYGGNGGNVSSNGADIIAYENFFITINNSTYYNCKNNYASSVYAPGGGGGYGGHGGNGYANYTISNTAYLHGSCGGGGGGYGGNGGDGSYSYGAGGGGGYGDGGSNGIQAGFAGGGYANKGNGGTGICIIQYYTQV